MSDTGGVLVVAETIDGALAPISAELVGAGKALADALGTSVMAVLLGSGLDGAASSLAALGPSRVLVADDERLAELEPDPTVATLAAIVSAEGPAAVLFGHTPNLREVAIRLAYRLQAAITTDCTGLQVDAGQ
ncbi:MAG TPA: electron transfer flavoprotein subunit alpha/FixB family protein, partial [Chloroflexota bacterium]|nr:electron transfer flavoprotein subunit alpha/FixB family protein [Chloroflexota bacterium]